MGDARVADRFTLPRLRAADAITDKDGRAVNAFVRFWDTVCRKIEGVLQAITEINDTQSMLIADLEAAVEAIQSALDAAAAAQTAADSAMAAAETATEAADSALSSVATINTAVADLDTRVAALEA